MRKLYPVVMIGGFLYWLFSDITGIGLYLKTGSEGMDMTIGWTMFGGLVVVIAALTRMVIVGHAEIEEDDYEEEEEVEYTPIKKTWMNDYYEDEAPKKSWWNDNWED